MPSTFDEGISLDALAGYSTNSLTTFQTSVTFNDVNTFTLTPNNVVSLGGVPVGNDFSALRAISGFTLANGPNIYESVLNFSRFAGFYSIANLTLLVSTSNNLTFSHQVSHGFVYYKTATNTLVFTELASRTFTKSLINTLTFTHQVSAAKAIVGRANNQLILSQNIARQMIYARNLTNIISFIGGGSKNFGFKINLPAAIGVLKPKKCLVILSVPQRTIVLPCPLLGDGQSFSGGKVDIKKSVIDNTLTYIRHTNFEKLKYTFNLGRAKTKELLDFVANFGSDQISMFNFKGESWLVLITNQPLEFVVKSAPERSEVALEFEGIQIA